MQGLFLELQQISTELYELTVEGSDTLIKAKKRKRSPKIDVFPIIKLDIPAPDPLVLKLVQIGTPRATAQELVEIHIRLVSKLASHHQRTYHEACSSVLKAYVSYDDDNGGFVGRSKIYSHLQHANRRLFTQEAQKWERDLVETCRSYYTAQYAPSNILQTSHSHFKLDFIPILEKIFKRTRFPSSAVKKVLSEKSGMSVKQIKDWFQNHRNRSRVSPKSGLSSSTYPTEASDAESIFPVESPSYAFPARYSSSIPRERDPIISRNIHCWPRKPSNYTMKCQDSNVDIDSLVSDFEKMRISKLSRKLKDATGRFRMHVKRKPTYSAAFPYTIPNTRFSLLSAFNDVASTLQKNPKKGAYREKSRNSDFFRVSRRVSQSPGLNFDDYDELTTPNLDRIETVSVKRERMKKRSTPFVEGDVNSPIPSLSKSELYPSPILSNILSPSLSNLSSDTQTPFDSNSLSSANGTRVKFLNSFVSTNSDNFYREFSLGEHFNIVSAYDILPVMPKFSDSIDLISVDRFPLRNFQYPIITF